jgi:RNA polymerase sigma factor (sigma-70 family)
MEIINGESLVRDAVARGLDDETVVQSVQSKIGQLQKQGVKLDWSAFRDPNPFWHEGFGRDRRGRRIGRKRTESALTRYMIEWLIPAVRRESARAEQLPKVFTELTVGSSSEAASDWNVGSPEETDIPCERSSRNVTTKDSGGILFATRPHEVRAHDADDLFRQLIPILWKISGEVVRFWNLPPMHRNDLVQEARTRIWAKLSTYNGEGWFKSWAASVARSAMSDYVARERRHASRILDEEVPASEADADAILDLHTGLRSAKDGRLLVLHDLLGCSERELAAAEGYEPDSRAISMRLSRARKEMCPFLA